MTKTRSKQVRNPAMPILTDDAQASGGGLTALGRELNPFIWIYFFLSFLQLRSKLWVTPTWFNGTLEGLHQTLLAFQYMNNEQSRVLQFYIPEFFVRVFGMSVPHAYIVQRWFFVGLSYVLFHLYLRRWFSRGLCFAAVGFLAAILPYSFANDLQESSCFLMVTFVAVLWAIRDGPPWSVAMTMLVGALNNETTLSLAVVYFANQVRSWKVRGLWDAAWRTAGVAAPAFAYTLFIRYVTRDRPHMGGAWQLDTNWSGILRDFQMNPLDYAGAFHLSVFFIFNVLWVFAFLHFREKPKFIRATLVLVPFFILPHMITGLISEVRQMIPLGFVVIPAAMLWMFRDEAIGREAVAE